MRYDFDAPIDRVNTDSLKWDCKTSILGAPEDALPLWVADMDFPCAEPIKAALRKRVEHGVFGYSVPGKCYRDAVTGWFSRRHGWEMDPASIQIATGVVPAIVMLLRCLTRKGEGVVIQEPVYNPFRECIEENGRTVVNNPLLYRDGKYTMDFDGLESCLASDGVKGLLFCSPHNPVGRVWTADELRRVAELCRKYRAWIISDEIHCDLVRSGHKHLPLETVCPEYKDSIITCTSPSKGFNLAGLLAANLTINDKALRRTYFEESVKRTHIGMISPFAIDATIAAYTEGEDWLDQLNAYIDGNAAFAREFFERSAPGVHMADCQATYLLWADFARYFSTRDELRTFMREQARVALNEGAAYGVGGETFARINAACPRATLGECLRRIGAALAGL